MFIVTEYAALSLEICQKQGTCKSLSDFSLHILCTALKRLTISLFSHLTMYSNAGQSLTTLVCPDDCWVELSFFKELL